jgi:6-pyruvoyltetrahydropterin 2'-reductase
MKSAKITYSEIFYSIQGEGVYTGMPTAWIRFWLCNLQCNGFGQKDPTDPSTYILPYQDLDITQIKTVEELPVFKYGCDSSYTWAKKFKRLMHQDPADIIVNKIQQCFQHNSNPQGLFKHPKTNQHIHMAFTGGEPMLNQQAIVDILREFEKTNNIPFYITVETNGTQSFKKANLDKFINEKYTTWDKYWEGKREWFWSVSPKLFSTSGELFTKAICPDVVASYNDVSGYGQLKYVVNGTQQSWDEVEQATELYRKAGVFWDVWIMPVGATKEDQESNQTADITMEAIRRGYNVSGRLHCHIFGNKIGT